MRRLFVAAGAATLSAVAVLVAGAPDPLHAWQDPGRPGCEPPAVQASRAPNIFTEEQENHLGDAVAERIQRDLRMLDDPAVAGHLTRIGERLIRHLPPTKLRFQFFVVDMSDANAFVLPGGRIYVTRKLIAFTQSEDELAGVLAHEIGHLLARQQTATVTRQLKQVLNVTELGDRQNVFDVYNRLMDNAARRPGAFSQSSSHEDRDQIEADRVGLYAVAAAGYDPEAHARLYDRFAETRGRTGNFFSDLFGTTPPESRRLREMIRAQAKLPAACIESRAAADDRAFGEWQTLVVAFTGLGRKESLHGVLTMRMLEPGLRSDLVHLRFSPDGRYLLAQDESGVTVLTRTPLEPAFRIEAGDADYAQFTPDSTRVVLQSAPLRVETWRVADGRLELAREVVLRRRCFQTSLSPDGKTLACLDTELGLSLVDVATSVPVYQKKEFYRPDPFTALFIVLFGRNTLDDRSGLITMGYSPDGRFFAAGQRTAAVFELNSPGQNAALVYDFQTKAALSLRRNVGNLISGGFAFTGPDRLMAFNADDPKKSAVISLPDGAVVQELPMYPGESEAVTKGSYLLVRPLQKFAVGLWDVAKSMGTKGNPTRALDAYDDVFVAERVSGELGIYRMADNQLQAAVRLPASSLGRLRTAAVSPDLTWLVVSGRSRGAAWDITTGRQHAFMRGFRGSHVTSDGQLFADLPKAEADPRRLGHIDLVRRAGVSARDIKDEAAAQNGPYLVVREPAKKGESLRESLKLDVRDVQSSASLWTRTFATEPPDLWLDPVADSAIFAWPVTARFARDEIRKSPALRQQAGTMKEKEGDYFLQVVDARTGAVRGAMLVETGKGSFDLDDVFAVGDAVIITDTENRVLVYSLSTGEPRGRVFGGKATATAASNLIAVENEGGRLALYDLVTLEKRDQFTFAHPVSLAQFSADGRRLFALTANQAAYVLDVSGVKK